MNTLVIGGTGPTGHFIVNGLKRRGHRVTILHSGRREIPETPDDIEHIHADAYSEASFAPAIENRTFDLCISNYGRLRMIANLTKDRVGRFISIGGGPVYRGYMNPALFKPAGLPVPTCEDAPLVDVEEEDNKGWRIAHTEKMVFEIHPGATHFRYPFIYGPYQMVPREWCVVRRIIDRRPFIIVPDDGLTLHTFGYAENLAHAVLLAVDNPEKSKGRIYNCGDEDILSLRQVIEIITKALDYHWEIVSMPWRLAVPARPMMMQPLPTHRYLDISKIKQDLGYRDVVHPADALAHTALWLAAHPPEKGGFEETVLEDPFDYDAEDKLVYAWKGLLGSMPEISYKQEPGFGMHYSGPGGRSRTSSEFSP
jgi:nucleoside-diphosphate-sugar epimerase